MFPLREAERRLQQKETPWAPVAYAVFLLAIAIIFCFAYTSYAFSKYRGAIIPGVQVDSLSVSGMSPNQARTALFSQINKIGAEPVVLTHGAGYQWKPTPKDIGFHVDVPGTVSDAMNVGRTGPFLEQLADRLPIHTTHTVPLKYSLSPPDLLRSYVVDQIQRGGPNGKGLYTPPHSAYLSVNHGTWHIDLHRAHPGATLDVEAAVNDVHAALGSLTKVRIPLKVNRIQPEITDADAASIQRQVERFLKHPPIIAIGKRVITTRRADFAPMFRFSEPRANGRALIKLTVDSNKLKFLVTSLANDVDRTPRNARVVFTGGTVQVVSPRRTGRSLDQTKVYASLYSVVHALKPNARMHFKIAVTQPPIDLQNPASLGIRSMLGMGRSSFSGAPTSRMNDLISVARVLNNTLIQPGQDISFNTIVGTNWLDRYYNDEESNVQGQIVPSGSGAMQQAATTFLRAMFDSGLPVLERHAHTYRLPWYEPPVGLDAVVAPGRNWDLRFSNTTKHYLLIEAQVQPIREEMDIWVYGPKLGWHVSVDPQGKVTKVFPHGPRIQRQDRTLSPGEVKQIAYPHDGADVTEQRTITYPDGSVHVDQLNTVYQPAQAIVAFGTQPTATPTRHKTPTITSHETSTPTPSVSATSTLPVPTVTPTFDH